MYDRFVETEIGTGLPHAVEPGFGPYGESRVVGVGVSEAAVSLAGEVLDLESSGALLGDADLSAGAARAAVQRDW
jgi:hypothetical protein